MYPKYFHAEAVPADKLAEACQQGLQPVPSPDRTLIGAVILFFCQDGNMMDMVIFECIQLRKMALCFNLKAAGI